MSRFLDPILGYVKFFLTFLVLTFLSDELWKWLQGDSLLRNAVTATIAIMLVDLGKLQEIGVNKGNLGLEMDVIPAELFLKIMSIFAEFKTINVSQEIIMQRMKKDQEEIDLIRTACNIMNNGHQRVLKVLF